MREGWHRRPNTRKPRVPETLNDKSPETSFVTATNVITFLPRVLSHG
jgi:hypothetical protein